jgi:hypothetical protein
VFFPQRCTLAAPQSHFFLRCRLSGISNRGIPPSSVTPYPRSRQGGDKNNNDNSSNGGTNSQAARNPYGRSRKASRSALQAIVLGKSIAPISTTANFTSSATSQGLPQPPQYQNYTRRVRRDKQFGSSLKITGGHNHDIHKEEESASNDVTQSRSSPSQVIGSGGASPDNATPQDMFQHLGMDDDDDDAMLSYIAFSN